MKNLRSLREARKLSQQTLVDLLKLDLAQSQIQSYETAAYEPDITTMKALADFFDTSIDYLVGRTDLSRKIEPVQANELNDAEMGLVERYRQMTPNHRRSLSMFMDALANNLQQHRRAETEKNQGADAQ